MCVVVRGVCVRRGKERVCGGGDGGVCVCEER